MSNAKPGNRSLEITVPAYIDEALNEVVLTFGIAKAEIVRHAIVDLQSQECPELA